MKVYAPTTKPNGIGGGFTFLRNFKKGMNQKVHFVDTWQECDIFFITSVTIVEKNEVFEAKKAGKSIVLRVDNVPRKSRNRRSSPHERLREFADLADVVIYQSQWARDYCFPLCGDGTVIYNGVDTDIFKPSQDPSVRNINRYLFAYHGKNEQKNFWEAHLRFQYIFRQNPNAEFWFIYDFGREDAELESANFDFWQGERFTRIGRIDNAEGMARIMQQCAYLIYPAISDAAPNVVLESRSCGCEIVGAASRELSGTQELVELEDISLERMCDEYHGVFKVIIQEKKQDEL